MDLHFEQAQLAKFQSEEKIRSKDYAEAKRLAELSESLFSAIDGIFHLKVVAETLLAGEEKVSSSSSTATNEQESNWYSVLKISESANEAEIKQQYRKLALSLHPDKNRAVGADEAFKLISDAYSVLSDKQKRAEFNSALQQNRQSIFMRERSSVPQHQGNHRASHIFQSFHYSFSSHSHSFSNQTSSFDSQAEAIVLTACPACSGNVTYEPSSRDRVFACPHCHQLLSLPADPAHQDPMAARFHRRAPLFPFMSPAHSAVQDFLQSHSHFPLGFHHAFGPPNPQGFMFQSSFQRGWHSDWHQDDF